MNAKRILGVLLAVVLLVSVSVIGTVAYLTSTDSATNTFTVGDVKITLDEAPVDANGDATTGDRVKANAYHLLPGHEYDKDPTVHFQPKSEASYLFIEVVNGIAAIEAKDADYTSIAKQIENNEWQQLKNAEGDDVANVFYKQVNKNASEDTAIDYPIFAEFKIDGSVNNTTLAAYEDATIVVTAYAVQVDGLSDAYTAWGYKPSNP